MEIVRLASGSYKARTQYADRDTMRRCGEWEYGGRSEPGVWLTAIPAAAMRLAEMAAGAADDETLALIAADVAGAAPVGSSSIDASAAVDADIDVPVPDGLAYLPFQRGGIAYALGRRDTLIADEMGLGKTVQAIGIVNADVAVRNVLVVAPAFLKTNWLRELSRWLVRPMAVGVASAKEWPETDVVVVNYDVLTKPAVAAGIAAREWDVLICDEAHYLKSEAAKRTKAVLGSRDADYQDAVRAGRRLFLTGTPILSRPLDLWPLVRSCGLFSSYIHYTRKFCAGHQTRYGYDAGGASNLDLLQTLLRGNIMVRRRKCDVLTALPPKSYRVIEAEGEFAALLRKEEEIAAGLAEVRAMRRAADAAKKAKDVEGFRRLAAQIKGMPAVPFSAISRVRHELALAKVPAVIAHVRGLLEEVPAVLVFGHHRDVCEAVAAAFPDDAVLVLGGMDSDLRQAAVDAMQAGRARVFVGSIEAAGIGLTLTAAAHVVFAEMSWTPGALQQAEDRAHRIGQDRPVTIDYIVVEGSMDAKLATTVARKGEWAAEALDMVTAGGVDPTTDVCGDVSDIGSAASLRQEVVASCGRRADVEDRASCAVSERLHPARHDEWPEDGWPVARDLPKPTPPPC